jgi:hypothetical protein
MTRKISAVVTALFVCLNSISAQSFKDVFTNSETPIFYLGIDFTQTRLIDDADANQIDILDHQYAAINDVIVNEPKKYELAEAFHKSEIDHDLGYVDKKNEKANAEAIKSTNTSDFHRFKESDITAIVSSYCFGDKDGIGLLFITEALSKSKKAAAVWVTLLDMKTKKVLMTERLEGSVNKFGGFGFRNYWASAFKDVIDTIDKKKYSEWKSKYGG